MWLIPFLGRFIPSLCNLGRLTGNKADMVLSQPVQQGVRVTLKGRETTCVGHGF